MHGLETIKRLNDEAAEKELADPGKNLKVKKFLEERRKAKEQGESKGEDTFQAGVELIETVSYFTLQYAHGSMFHIEAKSLPIYIGRISWTVFTDEFVEITDLPLGKVVIEDLQKSEVWGNHRVIEVK